MSDLPRKSKDGAIEITRESMLGLQVCSTKTVNEIEEWLRAYSPSGTSMGWVFAGDPCPNGDRNPVDCSNGNGRKHYLFTC